MSFLELPRMGETMEEGEVVAWVKKAGDSVKRGETVAEIQTDKIVAEMPALEDFVLEEILAAEPSLKSGSHSPGFAGQGRRQARVRQQKFRLCRLHPRHKSLSRVPLLKPQVQSA
jgi:Biotin-requiring enzyme